MTRRWLDRWRLLLDWMMTALTLVILILYSYAIFFEEPYAGINWSPSNGIIVEVSVPSALQVGDQLLQIGPVWVADYAADLRLTMLGDARPGQVIPVRVQRGDQTLTLDWVYPGFTYTEFSTRLPSQWWLAFAFWAVGAFALMMLRPRDRRQQVFAASNFLTAIWLAASGPSQWHIWYSAIMLRAAMWLCLPAYWHLHWLMPEPLGRLPRPIAWGGYLAAMALAAAEFLQIIPNQLYALGLVLALLGSLLLLIVRLAIRPAQRRRVIWLAGATALALVPGMVVGVAAAALGLRSQLALVALLFLPVLPLAYLYAAYRQQLGGLELRANLIVSVYLFLTLVGAILFTLVAWFQTALHLPNQSGLVLLITTSLTAVGTIFGFAPFQRFVEHRLLGMHYAPTRLIETYAARITASLNKTDLVRLLRDNILGSLLVRQSVLLRLDEGRPEALYSQGITAGQLPGPGDIPALLAQAGRYHPPAQASAVRPCAWVRLALPLVWEKKLIGLWLLGRRDPDDYYSQADAAVLATLANQTSIALINILQADSLHVLYQADIEQNEHQRTHLARELHDEILNDLASFKVSVDEHAAPPGFFTQVDALIGKLRQIILGLRPTMLTYGLRVALASLADDLTTQASDGLAIGLDLSPEEVAAYAPQMEQHLYRIVQQACENALRHARPQTIRIYGRLAADEIDLTVEDDGAGFDAPSQLDLSKLVAQKHFGLAGMFERAAIMGAELRLDSAPGRGTRVQVRWRASPE